MKKCPGVSERGLERRKRCFLALELHSWPLPTAIPVPALGEAPVLSCSILSCGWRCVALPLRQRAPPPQPLLKWVSWARMSQSSSVGSPPGQGLLQREGTRSPGLCLNTRGGLPLPPAACVHARTHTHTLKHTHAYAQMKETNDLDYILCYLVDYKSVKTSLYIENTSKECSLKRNKYTVTCMRCLVFMCSLNFPSFLVFQHSAQETPLKMCVVVKNVDHILDFSHIIKPNQFISAIIPCEGRATGGMLS